MNFISIFDVIGPEMIGPSSSHTAGAAEIARMARKLFSSQPVSVIFTLYGSFAKTYRGHGTDKALLGGIQGFAPDDVRIRQAFEIADKSGLKYEFKIDDEGDGGHPNTADILLTDKDGKTLFIRGWSIGGGKIKIVKINNIKVEFTGEYSTIIVKQDDKPGVIAHLSTCLANHNVNIAFMRLFREAKGLTAYTIIESDEQIPREILEEIKSHEYIKNTTLIQV